MSESRAPSPKPELVVEEDDANRDCLCPPPPTPSGPVTRSKRVASKTPCCSNTRVAIEDNYNDAIPTGVLFKFIKSFDGSREKLQSFITNCDNAINLGNESQKNIIFKFIQSQLEGKAETAVSIKEFSNWPQLREFLQTQFGEKKHYTHLLAELQNCKQLPNEPIHQFSLRIETSLSKLLTEISIASKSKKELPGRVASMEDLALHTFLLGLKPGISNMVRCRDPQNLNEAINLALSEEKIQNMLFQKKIPTPPVQQNSFQQPRQIQRVRPPMPQTNFCRYCKNLGHTIENCRKREFNNNRSRVSQDINSPRIRPIQFNTNYVSENSQDPFNVQMPEEEGYDTVDTQKN